MSNKAFFGTNKSPRRKGTEIMQFDFPHSISALLQAEENMSTNEREETQEINHNGCEKSETFQYLENKLPNSFESEKKLQEKLSTESFVDATLPNNEGAFQKSENSLEKSCEAIDNKESNQTSTSEKENSALSENSDILTNTKVLEVSSENPVLVRADMSRSSLAKPRMPNSSLSRSALPHSNLKLPAELSGQPSNKNTKEDAKYWKIREQELLSKIADLESRVTERNSKLEGPLDLVAAQIKEKLENDLMVTHREKENFKNRLQTIEKELYVKQKEISTDSSVKNFKNSDEVIGHLKHQNEDLRNALAKMTAILRDKTTMCISQEKKIVALMNQVDSLKEVVAITKDLLNIRNMEVQHLSNDISAMETKIDCERQRHNQMLIKMDEAVKLNCELKKEYENQLKLFQQLRDTYEEKILLLSREKSEKKEAPTVDKGNTSEGTYDSQT